MGSLWMVWAGVFPTQHTERSVSQLVGSVGKSVPQHIGVFSGWRRAGASMKASLGKGPGSLPSLLLISMALE